VPLLGLAAVLAHPGTDVTMPTEPFAKFTFILKHIKHTNKPTAILGFTVLGVLILVRVVKQFAVMRPGGKWLRFVPEVLILVVGATSEFQCRCCYLNPSVQCSMLIEIVLAGTFRWDRLGVDVIGKVGGTSAQPFGLPLTSMQMKYFNYTVSFMFHVRLYS
jgi:hypothetical protein